MSQASQPDENLIPGQTYTFQLQLKNWITSPSVNTVQSDLQSGAPDFVNNNLQVTIASTLNPLNNTYNVQFTYNGDGTDVVSDVASSIIQTIQQGSGDTFEFMSAYAEPAGSVSSSGVGDTINSAVSSATKTLTDTVNQLTTQASKSTQEILTPVEIAVGIVVVLVVFLIFTAGKSGGVSAGPEGVSVGGTR